MYGAGKQLAYTAVRPNLMGSRLGCGKLDLCNFSSAEDDDYWNKLFGGVIGDDRMYGVVGNVGHQEQLE